MSISTSINFIETSFFLLAFHLDLCKNISLIRKKGDIEVMIGLVDLPLQCEESFHEDILVCW